MRDFLFLGLFGLAAVAGWSLACVVASERDAARADYTACRLDLDNEASLVARLERKLFHERREAALLRAVASELVGLGGEF